MPATEIKVLGSARDSRTPDRAEVRFRVNKWGRERDYMHRSVTAAVAELTDALRQLTDRQPQALEDHSVAQISQRSWKDDIGTAYSESVDVTVVFTDFQVMSQWIFNESSDTVRVVSIKWGLSTAAQTEVSIALGVEAVREARRKAETFAVAAGLTITGLQSLSEPAPAGNNGTPAAGPTAPTTITVFDETEYGIDITPIPIDSEVRLLAHFVAEPELDSQALSTRRRMSVAY